jgi:uncharacterized protein YdiU (UPF0061 family)
MADLATLETLRFDNSYARLPEAFYAKLTPTPFSHPPYLISFNPAAAKLIDLDPEQAARPEFAGCFGGSLLPGGADPLAMLYAGHQFGYYVSQLGDGRAILLGEVRNQDGASWDLHLKGAGRTPYSRDGDGRAVLRSTIREYLCGEAMHGLGIATTRALCITASKDPVWRETVETGAMLLRMAPTHVRFGTFEVFYYRRQHEHLAKLADYVIERQFPALVGRTERYAEFFADVVVRTAHLIAKWQAVGFAHGVMNTDNMSIVGVTLDYGPFGFMDAYDAGLICNHSDHEGRYAFDRQPAIGLWNLSCLAQALLPLASREALKTGLDTYQATFDEAYAALMRDKLGLQERRPEDGALVADFLNLLQRGRKDYTRTFRALSAVEQSTGETDPSFREWGADQAACHAWLARYRERLRGEGSQDAERRARMNRVNPKYVLRNYLAQRAIERAHQHDFSEIERVLRLVADPYSEHPDMERYAEAPPNWGEHIVVSCSS